MEDIYQVPDSEGKAEVADRFRVMELRSGRRVRRSPPPRRVRSRRAPCVGADDRLSALPDDMLLLVLARLRCARSAARTGILSRRWRDLWTHLPDLTFRDVAPAKIEAALARMASSPSVPARLEIDIPQIHHYADVARLGHFLDAVARFSPRQLLFSYRYNRYMDLHLPCFPHTTSIEINGDVDIFIKKLPSGEFSALERLSLGGARVKAEIDTLVTRCPRLRELRLVTCTFDIKVHSLSLQTLDVSSDCVWISSIDIMTPMLKQLELKIETDTDLSVSISAPMVEKVEWFRSFEGTNLLFGFWCLKKMVLRTADSFRDGDYWRKEDPSVHVLCLEIMASDEWDNEFDLPQDVEFAQEIEKLPVSNFSVFKIDIETSGHVFGALVWRLLGLHQICSATKRLEVICHGGRQACQENCPCDEPKNWRCQSISLARLEEVHMKYFTGQDHEHDVLKLILRSSPMLNRVTLKLVPEFGGCIKKIYNTFLVYADVKVYVYFNSGELVPPPSD